MFTKRSPVANTDCEPKGLGPCSNGRYRRYHLSQHGEQWRPERIVIGDVCRTGWYCQLLASRCGIGISFRRQAHACLWDAVGLVCALGFLPNWTSHICAAKRPMERICERPAEWRRRFKYALSFPRRGRVARRTTPKRRFNTRLRQHSPPTRNEIWSLHTRRG